MKKRVFFLRSGFERPLSFMARRTFATATITMTVIAITMTKW